MKIQRKILWENRSGGGTSWFHPRCCSPAENSVFMTLQSIDGSDFYGPVCERMSLDGGNTWSDPLEIPGMGWQPLDGGISEAVCDVVPQFHAPTRTVLAIGANVYYRNGELFDSLCDWGEEGRAVTLRRYPVWAIRSAEGKWIRQREKLIIPDMENCSVYSSGSSQWLFRDGEEALIPLTFGNFEERARKVCTVSCRYDGMNLTFVKRGNILELPVGRGLLEPSIIMRGTGYLMTIRAEDGHGWHAESPDGLEWNNFTPWRFDDGEILTMSTTQQHFLSLGGKLFLVYTRNTGDNERVFRFRAPLLIAEMDAGLFLKRDTEQTVFPALPEESGIAGMGNFHPVTLTERTALVTVGEERSYDLFRGDTLAAFISL